MINEQDISNALKYVKEISSLKSQVQQLNQEIQRLEQEKKDTTEYLSALANQVYILENSLKECQLAGQKTQQL
jgi:uncharacterized coiled-coil DUF342 family protein